MDASYSFPDLRSLQQIREQAFAQTMDLVCERHAHYRRVMAERGLQRANFSSLADLDRLPLTQKADYMAAPENFVLDTHGLPLEMRTVWDTMYTTGSTSGKPTPFVSTSFDFFNILALQRNMLQLRGVNRSDLIANLFPLTQVPHGAWIRVLHAAASMNVPVFSALPGNPSSFFTLGNKLDQVVELVALQRATVLWGVPSFLYRVLQRAVEMRADFSAVRLVFVTGEAFGETARNEMQQALCSAGSTQSHISISYGATEMQGGMVECVAGSGYHNPLPAQMLVEIVDPDTHLPLPDGQRGLVVLTHLHRRGTVLLRYALGDISVRTQAQCPHCGAITDRLVEVPRRIDDLLKIKGMLVNPGAVVQALEDILGARPFQLCVLAHSPDRALESDVLELRVEGGADPHLSQVLLACVKTACGVTPQIAFLPPQALAATDSSWKSKKFADFRTH
ncbi:MAG: AMP-binding protein [Burkholderiaceae bacterium]